MRKGGLQGALLSPAMVRGALQNPPFLPSYVGLKMGGRSLLMERSDTGFLGTTQHLSHLHKQRLGLWGVLSEAGLSEAG